MHEYIVQGALGLARSDVLRIEDGAQILLYVWEGEVWLTEEGERVDRILKPGEWHRLERGGAALAYALRRATVTLTASEPAYYARRILLLRAGDAAPVALYDAARERRWWTALLAPAARLISVSP